MRSFERINLKNSYLLRFEVVAILFVLVLSLFTSGCSTAARVGIAKENGSPLGIEQATGNMSPERYFRAKQLEAVTGEMVADSEIYVQKRKVAFEYLAALQNIASSTELTAADAALLLEAANAAETIFSDVQSAGSPKRIQGRQAHQVALYVVNETEDYVVQFIEEPFVTTIGELGPGERSLRPVRLPEGMYELEYREIRIGRDGHYGRPRNRSLMLNIRATDTEVFIN